MFNTHVAHAMSCGSSIPLQNVPLFAVAQVSVPSQDYNIISLPGRSSGRPDTRITARILWGLGGRRLEPANIQGTIVTAVYALGVLLGTGCQPTLELHFS